MDVLRPSSAHFMEVIETVMWQELEEVDKILYGVEEMAVCCLPVPVLGLAPLRWLNAELCFIFVSSQGLL